MKLKIRRISTFIEKFGLFKGAHLYMGLRKNKTSSISLPGIRFPLYLRPGTTVNAIFDQVFVNEEYSFPFPFKPSVIIDVGAHIGMFTIYIKNLFP